METHSKIDLCPDCQMRMVGITLAVQENDVKIPKHKDVETEECHDTHFHKIYCHKDHLLALDYVLNNTCQLSNMPDFLERCKELKEVISEKLKEIDKKENLILMQDLKDEIYRLKATVDHQKNTIESLRMVNRKLTFNPYPCF